MKSDKLNPLLRSHHKSGMLAFAIGCFSGATANAATWNVDNSGNWGTAGNWSGAVPDAAGATAELTYDITAARTVTINISSRILGKLTIRDSDYSIGGGWNSYTLAANAGLSLILDNGASSATIQRPVEYSNSGNNTVNSTVSAPVLLNSSLNIANDSRLMVSGPAGNLLFTTGGITANSAGTKTITNNGTGVGGVVISGVIGDGTGQVAVTQNSTTSALTLSGANTYTGDTTVTSGTLTVSHVQALQNSALNTAGTGVITLGGVTAPTLGGLSGSRNLASVITTGYSAVTGITLKPVVGASPSYSGAIANGVPNMTLTKDGLGTQILSGTNTYSGATTVKAGTLLINGSNNGAGSVIVETGATLGGTGSIAGALNVSGTLSPGSSIETFASGALTLNPGAIFAYQVDSSAALVVAADLMKVAGSGLSLSGDVTLSVADLASGGGIPFAIGAKFSLINYSGSWNNGTFAYGGASLADDALFSTPNNTWQIDYNDLTGGVNFPGEQVVGTGNSFVNITAVPEPGTTLLGALGALALLRRMRRVGRGDLAAPTCPIR
jgi:autotransporter-associated beta strand protein